MMFGMEPTSSPTNSTGEGSRSLDSPPPMPPHQRRSPSVLFTPPADPDASSALGSMSADPMIQTMMAAKSVDMAVQRLSILYPDAVEPLAQFQMQFRQLIAGMMSMQSQMGGGMGGGMTGMNGMPDPSMGAPAIVPPMPMQQTGPSAGMQQGPSI